MIMNDRIPEAQKELAKEEGTKLPYEVGAEAERKERRFL